MSFPTGHHLADGVLVTKWSSKPADHKVVRVRNNQRRHRERVKCHIADLESRLEETQLELQTALSRIGYLTAELEKAKPSCSVPSAGPAAPDRTTTTAKPDDPSVLWPSSSQPPCPEEQAGADRHGASGVGHDPAVCVDGRPVSVAPSVESWSTYDAAMGDDEKAYCKLWPPNPTESTTRCRDAYRIILEQNYACLDASSLRGWLQPGFRGAHTPGDGCRVENKLLFALLDYISS